MILDLHESFLQAVLEGNDGAKRTLDKIALGYHYAKHLVKVPLALRDDMMACQHINPFSQGIMSEIFNSQQDYEGLFTMIPFKVRIIEDEGFSRARSEDGISIRPSDFSDFEFYEETHLLGENLLDLEVFDFIVRWYLEQQSLKDKVEICFYGLMGGGITSHMVYRKECELKQHFCLAIVDSDKKCPAGDMGDTAKEIIQADSCQPFNCGYWAFEEVSEIENIIPVDAYRAATIDFANWLGCDVFSNSALDLSYYDFKKGITGNMMKEDDVWTHWSSQPITTPQKEQMDRCNHCHKGTRTEACPLETTCKDKGKNIQILTNLSTSALRNVLGKDANGTMVGTNQLAALTSISLSAAQESTWNKIGDLILTWCCAPTAYAWVC